MSDSDYDDSSSESDEPKHKNKKVKKQEGAVPVWDFTMFNPPSVEVMKQWLEENCRKWCFQLEECPSTKRLHYQGRFRLNTRERKTALIKLMSSLPSANLTQTSKPCQEDFYYVKKMTSRVEGPWCWDDPKPVFIPKRFAHELYPFQQQVSESFAKYGDDARICNFIYDPEGTKGKSTIAGRLLCEGRAIKVNASLDTVKMQGECRAKWVEGKSQGFFFDLERANKNYEQIMMTIETILEGILQDWRYGDRNDVVTHYRPVVWCFANTMPDKKTLTSNRWRFWKLEDNQLKEF